MRNFEDFLVATLTFCMLSQNDLLRCKWRASGDVFTPLYKTVAQTISELMLERINVKRSCCGDCMRWSAGVHTTQRQAT